MVDLFTPYEPLSVGQPIPGLNRFASNLPNNPLDVYQPPTGVSNFLEPNYTPPGANANYFGGNPSGNTEVDWRLLGKDGVLIPGLNAFANLAGAYTGYQQYGLAKDVFDFNRQSYLRDLANKSQAYNTALEDRTRSRLSQEGARVPGLDRLVTAQTENRKVKGTL